MYVYNIHFFSIFCFFYLSFFRLPCFAYHEPLGKEIVKFSGSGHDMMSSFFVSFISFPQVLMDMLSMS